MNIFTLVFILGVALTAAVRLWLARRQIRTVSANRSHVPAPFADEIPVDSHHKAADYTLARTRFEMVIVVYHTLLVLLWTIGGGLNLLDTAWRATGSSAIVTGLGVIASVALVNTMLGLPFSWYRTFVIEQRFGFNHTGAWLFVTDLARSAAVTTIIGIPLIVLVLWLMSPGPQTPAGMHTAPGWWLYVWIAWAGFSLAMLWIYPAVFAPLFNRFSPLEDERLQRRVKTLLERTGFTSDGIFVMDGSRRSSHGNAYFTGLGSHKRIVFFDTLLGTLSPAEIEAVLAHELGHYKHRHVHKHLAASLLLGALALWALDWIMGQAWFYSGLGLTQPSNHGALLLFSFVVPIVTFFLGPLVMHVTRKHEYEADDFAAHQADGKDLARALVKLYRENAATLTPDPLYSAFYDTHPPAVARVAHLTSRGPTHDG